VCSGRTDAPRVRARAREEAQADGAPTGRFATLATPSASVLGGRVTTRERVARSGPFSFPPLLSVWQLGERDCENACGGALDPDAGMCFLADDCRDECNGDYWEPEVERVLDNGTTLSAEEPLGPGLFVSEVIEDAEYDEHDGGVVGVTRYIETTRITPALVAASRHQLPRPLLRVYSMPRRSVRHGGRRQRSRSTASRARSPGRLDPDEPSPAFGRASRLRNTLLGRGDAV
jgi:hypothetical protein